MKELNEIKQAVDIVEIIGKYVALTKKGREWEGVCPFHSDHEASLKVNKTKQIWSCFACGGGGGGHTSNPRHRSGGDVFDFLLRWGKTMPEAKAILQGANAGLGLAVQTPTPNEKPKKWTPIPSKSAPGQIVHFRHGKPSAFWTYRNAANEIVLIVCRFNFERGGKEVLPYTLCTDGEKKDWRWQGLGLDRPLYNLPQILADTQKIVLVVEGEKTAEAAAKLFPNLTATTWPGGANGIAKADWSVLSGRRVILWPDNDKKQCYGENHPRAGQIKPFHEQPGNAAMLGIAGIIFDTAKKVRWVENAPEFPDKWDVADAVDWSQDFAKSYVNSHLVDVPTPEEMVEPIEMVTVNESVPGASTDAQQAPQTEQAHSQKGVDVLDNNAYFTFLGFEKEADQVTHCFFIKETRTLARYNSGRLARMSTLIQLAPLDFWEGAFTAGRNGKVNIDYALNWLCRKSHDQGFFTSDRLRGRGAWLDAGRSVIHCGDRLVVNGKTCKLGEIKSRFVYEAGPDLGVTLPAPLSTLEANKLIGLFQLINFEREVDPFLLAGWCVISPICGALNWRPHLWVTGGAGTGKSWVMYNVVRRLLGKTGLAVQGETSEAGLRQLLQSDALPVVFDEAEGEDERAQKRMQAVLSLMRAASADDGGVMVKGSVGGAAVKFKIRSCFAFASIGISAQHQSDRSRITIVSLKAGKNTETERAEKWKKLQALHLELMTSTFIDKLLSRTISLLPTILENARTFSAAATAELGEQRVGDQIGAILAGVYSLYSNSAINYEKAVDWIRKRNWEDEKTMDESKDETRLLHYLLEHLVKTDTSRGGKESSIGELVAVSLALQDDESISMDSAKKRLSQLGIYTTPDYIYFSNTSSILRTILRQTPWGVNHHKILQRLDGAIQSNTIYFASGLQSRAVGIPTTVLGNAFKALAKQGDLFEPSKVITQPSSASNPNEEEELPF